VPAHRAAPAATAPELLGTRDRLVAAMANALQTRGLNGVGLNELLAQAGAPKGVLYHHFPGGKTALAVAAIDATVDRLVRPLQNLGTVGPEQLAERLAQWLAGAGRQLASSGFERGCPLATVALESTAADTELRAALAAAFARLRDALQAALARQGLDAGRAAGLASFVVAGYEGALLQARVAGTTEPLQHASLWLSTLIRQALPSPTPPPAVDQHPGGAPAR
jgi:TetR/AcrR family transcriptional repressor of lmrAB and yxaGH operons